MPPRVLLCLIGLYLWILVFFTRSHKVCGAVLGLKVYIRM